MRKQDGDALSTWRGDYLCLFRAWRAPRFYLSSFCLHTDHHHHFSSPTPAPPPPPPSPFPLKQQMTRELVQSPLSWCCCKFICLLLFMCYSCEASTVNGSFHYPNNSSSRNKLILLFFFFFFYKASLLQIILGGNRITGVICNGSALKSFPSALVRSHGGRPAPIVGVQLQQQQQQYSWQLCLLSWPHAGESTHFAALRHMLNTDCINTPDAIN